MREGQTAAGDRMLAIVREMLPNATVNALQLNRNVVCGRHKDAKNSAAESHIFFVGHYAGGALVFETGQRFEKRDVWHGPMQSRDYNHWNEDSLPAPGSDEAFCKYAVVARCARKQPAHAAPPTDTLRPVLEGPTPPARWLQAALS